MEKERMREWVSGWKWQFLLTLHLCTWCTCRVTFCLQKGSHSIKSFSISNLPSSSDFKQISTAFFSKPTRVLSLVLELALYILVKRYLPSDKCRECELGEDNMKKVKDGFGVHGVIQREDRYRGVLWRLIEKQGHS